MRKAKDMDYERKQRRRCRGKSKLSIMVSAVLAVVLLIPALMPDKADAATIRRLGYATTSGEQRSDGVTSSIVSWYEINDELVFCMQHHTPSVADGTEIPETAWTGNTSDEVKKVLYYGYKGPEEWPEITKAVKETNRHACGIALTSLMLDEVYSGGAVKTKGWNYDKVTVEGLKYIDFKNYVNSKPMPQDKIVGFDKTKLTTSPRMIDGVLGKATDEVKVTGTAGLSATITPPQGATLVKSNGSKHTAAVSVAVGESFHLEAPMDVDIDNWNTGAVGTKVSYQIGAFMHNTRQDLVCLREVKNNGNTSLGAEDIETSDFSIDKISSITDITDGNNCYSLENAEFEVWGDIEVENPETGKISTEYVCITTVTTDENGYGEVQLPDGSYDLKEVSAPEGYADYEETTPFSINGEAERVTIENTPQSNEIEIIIGKVDLETQENKPQGAASLEDAHFRFSYYDGYYNTADEAKASGEATREWVFKTDKDGYAKYAEEYLVSGDKLYYNSGNRLTLPLGTYVIDEIKAPEGYFMDDDIMVRQVTSGNSNVENLETYQAPVDKAAFKEQVYRGDLELVKVGDGDLKRMVNVPFSITSKTTGEQHTIVTDENGYASTESLWNKHGKNTNAGTTSQDGIWFGLTEPRVLREDKGALIYDTYIIKELPCEANEGYTLIEGLEVKVYRDNTTIHLGTLTDDKIEITTSARDDETETKKTIARDNVTIVDAIKYDGLKAGAEYTMKGKLIDRASGEPLLIKDEEITSEKSFVPEKSSGVFDLPFELDASELQGREIVVFERLYQGDVTVAFHEDIDNKEQTINFINPQLKTSAVDSKTGQQASLAEKDTTIIDTVHYEGMMKGQEYKVITTLMDKGTGEPVQDSQGQVVVKEKSFTNTGDGTFDVEIKFDATGMEGKTLVVFEEILWEDKVVAEHKDIESREQSIYFPKIGTKAYCRTGDSGDENQSKEMKPSANNEVVDIVEYSNLEVGKSYVLEGTIVDKATGKPLEVKGKSVVGSTAFTPEKENGEVSVKFNFDGRELGNRDMVVYEKLFSDKSVVALHEDIEDEDQSIYQKITRDKNVKTGDDVGKGMIILLALQGMALLGAIAVIGIGKKPM